MCVYIYINIKDIHIYIYLVVEEVQDIYMYISNHTHIQVAHHAGVFPLLIAVFQNGIVYLYDPGATVQGQQLADSAVIRLNSVFIHH